MLQRPRGKVNKIIRLDCEPPQDLDAHEQEAFTLESFEGMIQMASRANKDFILARVATTDPEDSSKVYHSYYDAQQINKIVFRAQPECNLLCRVQAKNPLNNMSIIGKILYFAVPSCSVERGYLAYQRFRWEQILTTRIEPQQARRTSCPGPESRLPDASIHAGSVSATNLRVNLAQAESACQMEPTQITEPGQIIYETTYLGSDEDYMANVEFRQYFEQNAVSTEDVALFSLQRNEVEIPVTSVAPAMEHEMVMRSSPSRDGSRGINRGLFGAVILVYLIVVIWILLVLSEGPLKGLIGMLFVLGFCGMIMVFIQGYGLSDPLSP